ncbi:aminodeoxychorismate lyase [Priestia aryabhattai]|uniref:aminodeoxychorismate lyase n=1 Tax=Priestia TaxID=2800373 RepID=UPI0012BA07DA|nr:aminodeoxychorismate lyase [Priestia megaterium]
MYIYVNGEVKPASEATISPFDHGYMYGLGLFETLRVYDGHPFLVEDHLDRLRSSLRELNIVWDYSTQDVLAIINSLLMKNNERNAYVRLNVSAGNGGIGLQVEEYDKPSTIVYMKSMPHPSSPLVKEGLILETKRNTPEGTVRLKSHHYLNNVLAKREVGSDLNKEGIFLTKEGFLAEGIVSNLFFVKDDWVYTPSLETGILNGITRQFIFTLLKKKNIEVVEGLFTAEQLLESDEAFVTNSIQEIVPLRSIKDKKFSVGDHTLTAQLQKEYRSYTMSLMSRRELHV